MKELLRVTTAGGVSAAPYNGEISAALSSLDSAVQCD